MTFHGKTCYKGFPFLNGIPFRTRLKEICIRSNDLGHPFKKICIHSNGLITRSIETSSRSNDLFTRLVKACICSNDLLTRSIKTSNRSKDLLTRLLKMSNHPFVKNIQPFEQLAHPFAGTPIRSNDLSTRPSYERLSFPVCVLACS